MKSDSFQFRLLLILALIVILIWGAIHGIRVAPEPIGSRAELFILGATQTIYLTFVAGILGFGMGIFWALGKLSTLNPLRWFCNFWIWIIRGTPLLIQVLFVYFALPVLCPWLKLNEFDAGCLALALNVGAYNAEVIRAGIQAVPKGQSDGAKSLGLSGVQTFTYIILPQAFKITLPPLVNNIVALLKDSSLVSAIGLAELSLVGTRVSSETFQPVPALLTVASIYLVLTTVFTLLSSALEMKLIRR